MECWNAWDGTQKEVSWHANENNICTTLSLGRRESKILSVSKPTVIDISSKFDLTDWTLREDLADFSGTVTYETKIEIDSIDKQIVLDLGTVREIAELIVNNQVVGVKMWAPYRFDISDMLQEGENTIRINISNVPANKIENVKISSGMLGPVQLMLS